MVFHVFFEAKPETEVQRIGTPPKFRYGARNIPHIGVEIMFVEMKKIIWGD